MKIIFDSEEQKTVVLSALAKAEECPYELEIGECECDKYATCRECWENAIEIEVTTSERCSGMCVTLGDAIQIMINSLETRDMQSYVMIDKLLEVLINKAKENNMVDLEAIAAKVREDVAKIDKKQTNYEKIISMGIDELVDWMFELNIESCEQIPFCKNYKKCMEGDYLPETIMCKKCLKEWLQ